MKERRKMQVVGRILLACAMALFVAAVPVSGSVPCKMAEACPMGDCVTCCCVMEGGAPMNEQSPMTTAEAGLRVQPVWVWVCMVFAPATDFVSLNKYGAPDVAPFLFSTSRDLLDRICIRTV